MIDGVRVKELALHRDERGRLMELLRCDEPLFTRFGQVYVTSCVPGYAKAWHCHEEQTDNFACLKGEIRLGLFDARPGSKTRGSVQELVIGMDKPVLVQVPPKVYHGFECVAEEEALVLNITDRPYYRKPFSDRKPDELRLPFDTETIPWKWKAGKGG